MVAVLQPLKHHKPIPIDRAVVLVGRGEDCDVVISGSKKISRKHCCLVHFDQSFLIRDLGSTNGVWVNGKRVDRESEMADGDRVAIGDVQFRFFPQGLRQAEATVSIQDQQSAESVNSGHPDDGIGIMQSGGSDSHDDIQSAIEIIDDDDLDDGMIYDDEDDDLIDDEELNAETPSELPPQLPSKAKGRPFQGNIESEPVINLDDSFGDEEIDDIIYLDDE